jgi:glycosyltransferase involved in cell wall biosynthesis
MRISLIGPVYPYRGGIAHFTTMLAKKLMEGGHEVQVISFKKQYPAWLYPGKSDKDTSPGRIKVPADYLLTPYDPFTWIQTIRTIKEFEPKKVVFPWWVTIWGPAFRYLIKRLRNSGIQTTFLIHNTTPHEGHFWDPLLAKETLKWADQFIVMSEKEKMRLETLIPDAKNISIVPHPIYDMFKPTSLSKGEIRLKLRLPLDKPVILFFGFIRPYKGLNILIDTLDFIISKGQEVHLLIAGEFWEDRAKYDAQIKTAGLEKYVHIFDYFIPDDEAAEFFEAANLFVAPYTDGTQSGAVKLALGFGLPIVVTDIISDPLIHEVPDLCQIVVANNCNALASGLINAIDSQRMDQDTMELLFNKSWQNLVDNITQLNVTKENEF